jgi:hypothetical protein
VRLEPAPLGFLEREGERLEQLARAEPDEAAVAQVDVGLVGRGVPGADAAVEAVAGDDQVGVGILLVALHVGLEAQLDAERLAARLQDVEQALAADAAEAVAARADLVAADVDLDVVPVVERSRGSAPRSRGRRPAGCRASGRRRRRPSRRCRTGLFRSTTTISCEGSCRFISSAK